MTEKYTALYNVLFLVVFYISVYAAMLALVISIQAIHKGFLIWKQLRAVRRVSREMLRGVKLMALALCLLPLAARAQTNGPTLPTPSFINLDFLTNVPTVGDFRLAHLGFSEGPLLRNGQVENENKFDGFFHTNWVLSLSGQAAPSASVLDNASLHFGYRMAWQSAQLMFQGFGRRTWQTGPSGINPSWQGGVNLDADFLPTTGGKIMIGASFKWLTSDTGKVFKTAPQFEFVPVRFSLLF